MTEKGVEEIPVTLVPEPEEAGGEIDPRDKYVEGMDKDEAAKTE